MFFKLFHPTITYYYQSYEPLPLQKLSSFQKIICLKCIYHFNITLVAPDWSMGR